MNNSWDLAFITIRTQIIEDLAASTKHNQSKLSELLARGKLESI